MLVTGASGFVGTHAVVTLRTQGYDVIGVSALDHDLAGRWPDLGPVDAILHLAGLATVGPSFEDPQRYIDITSSMMTNLGEAVLADPRGPAHARVIVVSSAALYGSSDRRLTEDSPISLPSPYAVAKSVLENQAQYYRNRGLDILIVRPFNHIGPDQAPGFIVPDLVAKLLTLSPRARLETGNLDSSRDYTDVRDVVRAYQLLMELPNPGHLVYNIASGRSRTGWELLEALRSELEMEMPLVDSAVGRKLDPSHLIGDATRLRKETGWEPLIPFEQSIREFVDSKRAVVKAPSIVAPVTTLRPRALGRAVVVGSTGFLGMWLVHRLEEIGVAVIGISRSRLGPLRPVPGLLPPTRAVQVDISDEGFATTIDDCDVVFFAAGSASVPRSLVDPVEDFDANARAVLQILDHLSRRPQPPVFVHVSSAAVYGQGGNVAMRESVTPEPLSPYGASKRAAEEYVSLYARKFGVPGLSVRPFSIYGPGQTKQVIYDWSVKLLNGESPLRVLGSPDVSRDFIHVDDVARGAIHAARHAEAVGEVFNLASGRETTLGALVQELTTIAGRAGEAEFSGEVRPGDPLRWRADISRLARIGFTPTVTLHDGLQQTYDWIAASGR